MPPDAAMRRPATLRSLTCHIGSENERQAHRQRIVLVGHAAARARRVGHREDFDLLGAVHGVVGGPSAGSLATRSLADARQADAHPRRHRARRCAGRGAGRRSRLGAIAGRIFSRTATRCWLIGAAGPWSVSSAWRSARDRALELRRPAAWCRDSAASSPSRCRCAARGPSCRRGRRRSLPASAARRRAAGAGSTRAAATLAQSSSAATGCRC